MRDWVRNCRVILIDLFIGLGVSSLDLALRYVHVSSPCRRFFLCSRKLGEASELKPKPRRKTQHFDAAINLNGVS